jgi:hypothetical protein
MENFYTVKEFSAELKSKGVNASEKSIRYYIESGTLAAKKDILRPSRWLIPVSELDRVSNLK